MYCGFHVDDALLRLVGRGNGAMFWDSDGASGFRTRSEDCYGAGMLAVRRNNKYAVFDDKFLDKSQIRYGK